MAIVAPKLCSSTGSKEYLQQRSSAGKELTAGKGTSKVKIEGAEPQMA